MSRYHLLHAGASWIDEYGDPTIPPTTAARRGFAAYSLYYHRVTAGVKYPPVMFTTSTAGCTGVASWLCPQDGGGMQALGVDNVWYRENTEGGHGGLDELVAGRARRDGVLEFLRETLGVSA